LIAVAGKHEMLKNGCVIQKSRGGISGRFLQFCNYFRFCKSTQSLRPSVCLSIRPISPPQLWVCCCGPSSQEMSFAAKPAGWLVVVQQQPRRVICSQCHFVSQGTLLNTDLLQT